MSRVEKREAFPPGTIVGERYRIVSALARGGFGVVYVAEQLATARRVALKLLTSHLYEVSVDRLLAEARIASRVNSEHIVQVFDAGIDPESSLVFVAMELLSGTTLGELVQKRGPRGASETVEYLRQVAIGLDKVHGVVASDGRPAPIVHRDLKPANLFLTKREDGAAWIKILDFGAAKVLSDDGHVSGILRGTPEYMAYEQAAGGEITPATDIWALGLVAFFLLTGRPYWRGAQTESGRQHIFGEVLTLPLVAASERARELAAPDVLGPTFDEWFSRCVNRDPSARFRSAGEAARELGRALDVDVRSVVVPVPAPAPHAAEHAPNAGEALPTAVEDAPDAKAVMNSQALAGVTASSGPARPPRPRLPMLLAALLGVLAVVALISWSRPRPTEVAHPVHGDADVPAAQPMNSLGPAVPPPAFSPPPSAPAPSVSSVASSPSDAALESSKPASRSARPGGVVPKPRAVTSPSGTARASHQEDVYDLR
jgi:eukaryotic-like serine/threonine-protein kinase